MCQRNLFTLAAGASAVLFPPLFIAFSISLCSSCSENRAVDPAAQDRTIVARYGTPNLIQENSGEISRAYLPGTDFRDERWPFAEKSYYFLPRRERIVVKTEGAREVRPLTDAEVAEVAEIVRRLQQVRAQLLATRRTSPGQ